MGKRRKRYRKPNRGPIAFGITMEKYLSHRFWPNFHKVERSLQDYILTVALARTDLARNKLVKLFLETNATHLLFLDSDQLYPPDTVVRLLAHKKLVVGCLYFHRQPPYQPHAYTWFHEELTPGGEPICRHIPIEKDEKRLIECDAIGTGGLMVAREVYTDIIEPPWFEYGGQWDSEDITFCRKLAKAGVKVYVDTACESGHLSEFLIGRDNYLLYKAMAEGKVQL